MRMHGDSAKTTEGIQAPTVAQEKDTEPEWARVAYITKRFQIGRTLAFRHVANGTWKSVLLRERGNKTGIRLVYVPSVREHLNGLIKS